MKFEGRLFPLVAVMFDVYRRDYLPQQQEAGRHRPLLLLLTPLFLFRTSLVEMNSQSLGMAAAIKMDEFLEKFGLVWAELIPKPNFGQKGQPSPSWHWHNSRLVLASKVCMLSFSQHSR